MKVELPVIGLKEHADFGVDDPKLSYANLSYGTLWNDEYRGKVQGRPHSLLLGIGLWMDATGKLLDNMLFAMELDRNTNVYIANVLKCRPPGNRNPEPGEVARCSPYLERQVELLKPKLILAMGRFAIHTLLQTEASVASLIKRGHYAEALARYSPEGVRQADIGTQATYDLLRVLVETPPPAPCTSTVWPGRRRARVKRARYAVR